MKTYFTKVAATISLALFVTLIGFALYALQFVVEAVPRFLMLVAVFLYGGFVAIDVQIIRGKLIFRRTLKPDRIGNFLFIPETIGLRSRFHSLGSAIETLFTRTIDVHYEDGTWHRERFGGDMKLGTFLSEINTFLVGYRYRMVDLDEYEDYKALVFLEWVNNLSEDTRSAVMAEYLHKGDDSHED